MNKEKFSEIFSNLKPSPMLQMFEAAGKYDDIINMGIGEPDFDTPKEIIEAAQKAAYEGFTHYGPVNGFADIRGEIVKYWADKYNVVSDPEEVMMTVGAVQAIYLALQSMIDPGDEIIVTDPCFTPYIQAVEYLRGTVVFVPVYEENGFNVTREDLEKVITDKTKAIILNTPGNPTGAIMTKEEVENISELIIEKDIVLISDEVYEALLFEGNHYSFGAVKGMKERTYIVGGFSKTYAMTGWRIGYVICPDRHAANLMKIISIASTMGTNTLAQKAALYAMKNSNDDTKMMVEKYRERIDVSWKRLNDIEGLSCIKPRGSFYLFANIEETGLKSLEFSLKLLDEAHVIVIPGIAFGENGDNFVRLSCALSIDKLNEVFDRIEKVIDRIRIK
jgi:aspartate/methionine/tyrosine aminotransferase